MVRSLRRYGTRPDIPDPRDHVFRIPSSLRGRLPARADLRKYSPPVWDQGSLNACSAHAIAGALWYDEIITRGSDIAAPSRLFLYYNERALEDIVGTNAPVSLRDGYRSISAAGTCS